jgi:hypothetical protein
MLARESRALRVPALTNGLTSVRTTCKGHACPSDPKKTPCILQRSRVRLFPMIQGDVRFTEYYHLGWDYYV